MLKIEGVTAGYAEIDIIHEVSMRLEDGETVTIIGPNGAGKSTVMKTVFGLTSLRSGTISFKGREISGLRTDDIVRLGISYVPQEKNVFPTLTVRENLEMGAFIRGCRIEESLEEVLRIFPELGPRMKQRAGTMSGGEQKMLAIARALVIKPVLLMLDEPSAALSPKLVDQVFAKIREISGLGTAIMMVEQNAKKALAISDRGYIMETGRVRFEGRASSLLEDADVRKLYMGC